MSTILNQASEWSDVQHLGEYDVQLSFVGRPDKEFLPSGTALYRLDFPVVLWIFMKVWWMKKDIYDLLFERAGSSPSTLRREWQNTLAMKDPARGEPGKFGGWKGEAGVRTQVLAITTMLPVFAWVGKASPLFDKDGGAQQVYLPNLASGAGPFRSDHARLLRTFTLRAI